jgi:hypothetical protein
LADVVQVTVLGPIADNEWETIKTAIITANPDTTIGIVWAEIVYDIEANYATLDPIAYSTHYVGTVTVTFSIK